MNAPVSAIARTTGYLAAHAVCVAAAIRDGLRAAQFYIRDLSHADGFGRPDPANVTWVSRTVAGLARFGDRTMSRGADLAIRLILPSWRTLPSPFTPGLMWEMANAIREERPVANPLFNAYFFRAALHILERSAAAPFLVLEHRVDAARRQLGERDPPTSRIGFLARTLIALVEAGPVARVGPVGSGEGVFGPIEPNVAVFAIAAATLLFAEEGKPAERLDEDGFFAVAGALIAPRLGAIAALVEARDEKGLAKELSDIRAMY